MHFSSNCLAHTFLLHHLLVFVFSSLDKILAPPSDLRSSGAVGAISHEVGNQRAPGDSYAANLTDIKATAGKDILHLPTQILLEKFSDGTNSVIFFTKYLYVSF